MIADRLSNLSTYSPLNRHITDMVKFLSENSLAALSPGRHQINGDDFFLLIFHYDSKPEASAGWEAHRKYLDIHTVIEGAEKIFFEDIGKTKSTKPYDEQN